MMLQEMTTPDSAYDVLAQGPVPCLTRAASCRSLSLGVPPGHASRQFAACSDTLLPCCSYKPQGWP